MSTTKNPLNARMEIASEITEWVADQGREYDLTSLQVNGYMDDVKVHVDRSLFQPLAEQFALLDAELIGHQGSWHRHARATITHEHVNVHVDLVAIYTEKPVLTEPVSA